MKTLSTLLLTVMCFSTNTLLAQLKLFGALDFVCGWSAGCDELNSNFTLNEEYDFTDEGIYGSYGAGPAGGLSLGVNVCGDPVDVLLGFFYFRGKEISYFDRETAYGFNFNGMYSERVSGFMLEPRLRFRTDLEGKFNFYANAGLLVPVGVKNVITADETSVSSFSTMTTNSVLKQKGGMTLGYSGGVGTTFNFTPIIALFGELYYRGISVPWKNASLTEYTSTSTNPYTGPTVITLADLEVNQREIEYEKEITQTDNISQDLPSIQLKDYDPVSSWGIKIGLQFLFESSGGGDVR